MLKRVASWDGVLQKTKIVKNTGFRLEEGDLRECFWWEAVTLACLYLLAAVSLDKAELPMKSKPASSRSSSILLSPSGNTGKTTSLEDCSSVTSACNVICNFVEKASLLWGKIRCLHLGFQTSN